ncbi:hypothetical protein D9M72_567100 [compost metagenome]
MASDRASGATGSVVKDTAATVRKRFVSRRPAGEEASRRGSHRAAISSTRDAHLPAMLRNTLTLYPATFVVLARLARPISPIWKPRFRPPRDMSESRIPGLMKE